jgi:hypothetical protein
MISTSSASNSPDLAPRDFCLFGYLKRALQESEFQTAEELLAAVVEILSAIPTETLMNAFHEWIRKLQSCVDTDGEYVESGLFSSKKLSAKLTHYGNAQGGVAHPWTFCGQGANGC